MQDDPDLEWINRQPQEPPSVITVEYKMPRHYGDPAEVAELIETMKTYPRASASVDLIKAIRDGGTYVVCWREELRAPADDERAEYVGTYAVVVTYQAAIDRLL